MGDLWKADFRRSTIKIPTVVTLLKRVLSQYPDSGQIIKELVQNAEDAGARVAEVCHHQDSYASHTAPYQLSKFVQSPAVCVYNDAVFTKEDWDGVTMLSDSIKKLDPRKVGRFGLGFKSVFHITDFVIVVSGDEVLFMDPSQPGDDMCLWLPLKSLTTHIPQDDCLYQWGQYVTPYHLKVGYLPGSLFWFPLRQQPSDISSVVYDYNRVNNLFNSFALESSISLIFLKNLEKITLKNNRKRNFTTTHEVSLSVENASREDLKKHIDARHQGSSTAHEYTCSYEVTITNQKADKKHHQKLVVMHYFPDSDHLPSGMTRKDQLPLVAVAAPLCQSLQHIGHTFCFLPLPLDLDNNTGLPVYVNGYFVLTENRRNVQWKSEDIKEDPDMEWNEWLKSDLMCEAYYKLLLKVNQGVKCGKFSTELWYHLLPNLLTTHRRWQALAHAVWYKILTDNAVRHSIIWSQVRGSFVGVSEAVITESLRQSANDKVYTTVCKALRSLQVPLASIDTWLWKTLCQLKKDPNSPAELRCLKTVTGRLVREFLKNGIPPMSNSEKIIILEFVLQDKDYQDLQGVPLLPLQNGKWETFSRRSSVIHLCTNREASALLGLESRIVNANMPPSLECDLRQVAVSGATQLRLFTLTQDHTLLQQSVEAVQILQPSVNRMHEWLTSVWSLLQLLSLSTVSHLSVVPSSKNQIMPLICLSCPIIVQTKNNRLSGLLIQALNLLGIQVLSDIPDFVRHPDRSEFIFESDHYGINKSLEKASRGLSYWDQVVLAEKFNSNCTQNMCVEFCRALDPSHLQPSAKELIQKLNIFKCRGVDNRIFLNSIASCDTMITNLTDFPLRFHIPILIPQEVHNQNLAFALGVNQLTLEDLCVQMLQSCNNINLQVLVKYIFESPLLQRSKKLLTQLSHMAFVSTPGGRFQKICELYDPEDNQAVVLLGEDLIPSSSYKKYLPILRGMGLRCVKSMNVQDIVQRGRAVEEVTLTKSEKIKKSLSLLDMINFHKDCKLICEQLECVFFVFGVVDPPRNVPSCLPWATSERSYQPREVKSFSAFSNILGSVFPMVLCDSIPEVAEIFGWKENPSADLILRQLQIIVEHVNNSKIQDLNTLRDICHNIYRCLDSLACTAQLNKDHECLQGFKNLYDSEILLTKDGFKKPKLFASSKDCSPDLFSTKAEGIAIYSYLTEALGITNNFTPAAVAEILQEKNLIFQDRSLSATEVEHVSNLLHLLFQEITAVGTEPDPSFLQSISIPDADGHLCSVLDLCIDDGKDVPMTGLRLVHPLIRLSAKMTEQFGLRSKTRKRLQMYTNRIRFGQREPLTTRLRGILSDYPCDCGIMKELLQNADDAQASRVVFIKDKRTLPCQKLLDEKMTPLQGPALCVYNDSCFTEFDLESIQSLGNSIKAKDPASTGQYGIGFNAVYHLTDAPSFITRGPHVPGTETLCMFDPCCQYYHDAIPEYPGVRFDKLSELRKCHSDSFLGYFEDTYMSNNGTLFRLPLRTSEASLISTKVWSIEELDKITNDFKVDMEKSLLFVKNVREISIVTVAEDGTHTLEHSVVSKIIDDRSLENMKAHLKQHASELYAIAPLSASYEMKITANGSGQSKETFWYIVQQLGTQHLHSVPQLVKDGFENKTLKLLPHGGVALLLKSRSHGNPHGRNGNLEEMPATSCYLPLPIVSGLPFSINGHFALNSSRRDLWSGTGDCKNLWNEWLLKEIVTVAAVSAIEFWRKQIFEHNECKIRLEDYKRKVNNFHLYVPKGDTATSVLWKSLVKEIYAYAEDQGFPFYDVYIPDEDPPFTMTQSNKVKEPEMGNLKWFPLNISDGIFQVHFHPFLFQNSQQNYGAGYYSQLIFVNTLKRLGLKIGNEKMIPILESADIKFSKVNPEIVLEYLKTFSSGRKDKCKLENGAYVIERTPFRKIKNLCLIFRYVSRSSSFDEQLHNLPLLVTEDRFVRCFSQKAPVFITTGTTCWNLFPESANEFMHSELLSDVQHFLKEKKKGNQRDGYKLPGELKIFTMLDLTSQLDRSRYCILKNGTDVPILGEESYKLPYQMTNQVIRKDWLKKLWYFIISDIEDRYKIMQNVKLDKSIESESDWNWKAARSELLKQLGAWALFPAARGDEYFTIPIQKAKLALDTTCMYDYFNQLPITKYLKEWQIPEDLDLPCSLQDPVNVLEILFQHKKNIKFFLKNQESPLKLSVAGKILYYFGNHVDKSLPIDRLRALPLYENFYGEYCALENKHIIVLADSDIPVDGLRELEEKVPDKLLLKPPPRGCDKLYEYLDETYTINSSLSIYDEYILPNFHYLQEGQRLVHLKYLKKELLHTSEKHSSTINLLKETPFIEVSGILYVASEFYDHDNKIFQLMKPSSLLPWEWRKHDWKDFLKLSGMMHEVTNEMFIEFAQTLSWSDSQVQEKSEALIGHLFWKYKELKELIPQISEIKFIVPGKTECLEELHAQHETPSGLTSFSRSVSHEKCYISWTSCCILPEYANPTQTRHMMGFELRELDKQQKLAALGISDPPAEKIIQHVKNLGKALNSRSITQTKLIEKVMEELYKHINDNEDAKLINGLHEVPVILNSDGSKLVTPDSVVLKLQKPEREIIPYLYEAPIKFGSFYSMFQQLGVLEESSCSLYAHVLKMIYDETGGQEMSSSQRDAAWQALLCLTLKVNSLGELSESVLYLPTRKGLLVRSLEIFVPDNNRYEGRICDCFDDHLLVKFTDLKVDITVQAFIQALPEKVRPRLLSEVLRETLNNDKFEEVSISKFQEMKCFIQSDKFCGLLRRLIYHRSFIEGKGLSEEEEIKKLELLGKVEMKELCEVETKWTLRGKVQTQTRRSYFVECIQDDNHKITTVYIDRNCDEADVITCLAEIYATLFTDNESLLYVTMILNHYNEPRFVDTYLTRHNITSRHEESFSVAGEIGTYVKAEYMSFIVYDFQTFETDEVVALQKFIDDDDALLLAKVVKCTSNFGNVLSAMYEVSLGYDTIEVKGSQLYKILSPEESLSDVSLAEKEVKRTIQELMKEIGNIENEMERHHLLRRLVHRWKPERNPAQEDLCCRMLEYIEMLSKETSDRREVKDALTALFVVQNAQKIPNKSEAAIWLKQAVHDGDSAQKELDDDGSHCWIAYKCQQAAEKALKAAVYLEDRDLAVTFLSGALGHDLMAPAGALSSPADPKLVNLAMELQSRVGSHTRPRYPASSTPPYKLYDKDDSQFMIVTLRQILAHVKQRF